MGRVRKRGRLALLRRVLLIGAALSLAGVASASAGTSAGSEEEDWSFHAQATFTEQFHPRLASPYRGGNSLDPGNRGAETFDATLFLGARLWQGAEVYADPEADQGFGLGGTLGVAAFPSAEAYKLGSSEPYFRLQRVFLRQTINLGGPEQAIAADANQLAGTRDAGNLILTIGKFSVTDIFDNNSFAHDPKHDFLSWGLIDAGTLDYAADAWGYSYGASAELNLTDWSLRAGLFNLSRIPNTTQLQRDFSQYELLGEVEYCQTWFGAAGKLKLTGFYNRGRMGDYNEALALAAATQTTPSTAAVRRMNGRAGVSLNLEQPLTGTLSLFARIGVNDGSKEAYEYTEINSTFQLGVSLAGAAWGRPQDAIGLAAVSDALSRPAQRYFAAGGLGILIGDGRLNYGRETALEAYYSAAVTGWLTASADYQYIDNPAYNRDRGPVHVFGLRLHAQF